MNPQTNSPAALLSVGDLIRDSWNLYAKNWKTIVAIVFVTGLIIGGIFLVGFLVLLMLFGVGILAGSSDIFSNLTVSIPLLIIGFFAFLVFVFAVMILGFWGQIAIYETYMNSQKIGVFDALKKSWPKLIQYWWIGLIVGIIVTGGMLFFFVPGIIFMVWFFFAQLVFVTEGKTDTSPLVKSREYVRGRWLGVVGRLILLLVVFVLVNYVLTFLISLGGDQAKYHVIGVSLFISYIIGPFVLMPFSLSYFYTLFRSLQKTSKSTSQSKSLVKYSLVALLGYLLFVVSFVLVAVVFGDFLRVLSQSMQSGPGGDSVVQTTTQSGNFYGDSFAQANNQKRKSDINAIRNGIYQYSIDSGEFPKGLVVGESVEVSSEGTGEVFCTELVPNYLAALPSDPLLEQSLILASECSSYDTGYFVLLNSEGDVIVSAPQAELDEVIDTSYF